MQRVVFCVCVCFLVVIMHAAAVAVVLPYLSREYLGDLLP